MGENLVIVESPAKAKTIEGFLGKDFTVKSSFGHIRDLSKKHLGIDIEHGFKPDYLIPDDKKKVVQELKSLSEKASTIWLASDEDREGEAIAWHLQQVLGLKPEQVRRIVFHEITKSAILNAIENPREINSNLVMAQQARRILDRIVGFELSPILWKKVASNLSAGRVQSVAVRLIVEREREILAFNAEKFYKVTGRFRPEGKKALLDAVLDQKFEDAASAASFLEKCRESSFRIADIKKKDMTRCPAPPFTTSALQQEASRKLGFSVSQTMRIAQKLYESGLITYMRTDSTNLSQLALNTIKQVISATYGEEYSKTRQYKTKSKGAQEAHEAIRPTYPANATIEGTAQEKRLYSLIWKRCIASQMADAKIEKTNITIEGSAFPQHFICSGEQVVFDGFLKLYMEGRDDDPADEMAQEGQSSRLLPELEVSESFDRVEIAATERFGQRPPRYSEASLVKKLEELGIGRPSTYAPTITTITQRGYIVKEDREGSVRNYEKFLLKGEAIEKVQCSESFGSEKGKLFPQDIGMLVTDFLKSNFAEILDYGFTAKVEEDFDKIAAGKKVWNNVLESFYRPFHSQVEKTLRESAHKNAERVLGNDPKTGKILTVRLGKFGPLVQMGTNDDPEKKFAGLQKGQLIESITLEEALELFTLPRKVGQIDGKDVTASSGRFGPYIKYDGKYISIKNMFDPHSITLEQAAAVMEEHNKKEADKHIASFPEHDIEVINGRFGPYIKHGSLNYKIPKGTDAKALTADDCLQIISKQSPGSKSRKKK
ncbi:MAG: type I DNA topoisomerase [Bacteroidetes bacterium]|uniref:DNA topoisomerase 1 n=1 Tax=Candidatus Egerieousia excrementavium TaxID=2840778 RepID=A0A9D9GVA0_9BACT|nr:type I DNA topoisomerase [Candidatus Egerieousia excrementavium]